MFKFFHNYTICLSFLLAEAAVGALHPVLTASSQCVTRRYVLRIIKSKNLGKLLGTHLVLKGGERMHARTHMQRAHTCSTHAHNTQRPLTRRVGHTSSSTPKNMPDTVLSANRGPRKRTTPRNFSSPGLSWTFTWQPTSIWRPLLSLFLFLNRLSLSSQLVMAKSNSVNFSLISTTSFSSTKRTACGCSRIFNPI